MAEKKLFILKSPFHYLAGGYRDDNRGCRGYEAGKHDGVGIRGTQFFTQLDSHYWHYRGEGHVYYSKSAHIIAGCVSEMILRIQLFHGSKGEDGGTVACTEDVGHEAHYDTEIGRASCRERV